MVVLVVVIGWLYVTLLMAAATLEESVIGAIATFLFYGLIPAFLIAYIMTAKERRRRRQEREVQEAAEAAEAARQKPSDPAP